MQFAAAVRSQCLVAVVMASLSTLPALAQTPSPRDPKLAPAPVFIIKNDSLTASVPMGFAQPEDAKAHIERTHLSWPWKLTANGRVTNGPIYCTASAPLFTKSDFAALSWPSYWSAETPLRVIKRNWGACLQWTGNVCTSFVCTPDSQDWFYNMRADCPYTEVFAIRGGEPVCECPAGSERERNAAGEWRCARPAVASVQNPACYRHDGSCPAGNPVMPGIAAKLQTEVDYEGVGANPLSFTRSFRSQGARPYVEPGTWSHWTHNWARRIEVYPEPGRSGRAYLVREDASQRIYHSDGGGSWSALQTGDRNQLVELVDPTSGDRSFEYRLWADDSVEHYGNDGKLLRVVLRNGWTTTLSYSTVPDYEPGKLKRDRLLSVRNHFGRELRFSYDAAGRLAEVLPPGAVSGTAAGSAASPIRYGHDEAASLGGGVAALGQLTSVSWQDGSVRRYHYENERFPQFLTGITDELGVRIGTYAYNTSGQLESSAGPNGMNAVDLVYRGSITELTDRSGATPTTSVYTWETADGVIRPTSVSAPCAQCGSTSARTAYTEAGDVARRTDHDGRITFFSYDARGRETTRATFAASHGSATTRPALALAERVVSTRWHRTWNLPTRVAEPGKITTYSYGVGGRLTGESRAATTDATGAARFKAATTGSTRATRWSYNASHLPTTTVESVDGVETRQWTARYAASGDLRKLTATEASTSATVSLATDDRGQLLDVRASGGSLARFDWSPRGALERAALGDYTLELTNDARMLPTRLQFSSGQSLTIRYDAAGQPTELEDESGALEPIAGVRPPASTTSRRLAGLLELPGLRQLLSRVARLSLLPQVSAQVLPMPPIQRLLAEALSKALPGAGGAARRGDPDQPPGCCGQGPSQQPGVQFRLDLPLAPPMLVVMAASLAAEATAEAISDELLILRSTRKLQKNMCAQLGIERPAKNCWRPHHIVAVASKKFPVVAKSQEILRKFTPLGVEDGANGVWLECKYHDHVHTGVYHTNVYLMIRDSTSYADLAMRLRMIASQLELDAFPYR